MQIEREISQEVIREEAKVRSFAVRSKDLTRNLDIFLACAVAGVLGNRFFLVATGYPQLGGGTLHISHAIWGGLMMVIAIVVSLSFIAPGGRPLIAVIGGAGFGWFVDELGKYITKDTNYFFRPTLALIYVVFIALYLVFRTLEHRKFRAEEGLLNALEALKAAAIGRLDERTRKGAIALLDGTCSDQPLAAKVRALLHDASALPDSKPNRPTRFMRRVEAAYEGWTQRRGFAFTVGSFFIILGIFDVAQVLILTFRGHGIRTFTEWATVGSSIVSLLCVAVGAALLVRSRLLAFRWFEASVLVAIFVTQVFLFADQQLSGVVDLIVTLAVWLVLGSAIRLERLAEGTHAGFQAPTSPATAGA